MPHGEEMDDGLVAMLALTTDRGGAVSPGLCAASRSWKQILP
jgi:hypothetical protein